MEPFQPDKEQRGGGGTLSSGQKQSTDEYKFFPLLNIVLAVPGKTKK